MSIVGKSSQYTSGFSPTSIPGCALWLDAADSTSLTLSGSNVTGWRDKSGTARTVTFSNTVTYTSATPSVNTSMANSSRIVANVDLRKSVVRDANIFIVYAWSGFSGAGTYNQFLWGQDIGGGWNRIQFLSYPAATSFAYNLGYRLTGGPPYSVAVSNMATSNRLIYHATYSYLTANATGVYINGTLSSALVTEGAASPETTSTSTVFGAGNLDAGAPIATVEFNEILIFSNAITVSQRQQIEGYLARKWSLASSLPATQPFRTLPLFTRPFVPVDIPGCALWLDGADSNAMTFSGANIVQWLDKSGNGRHGSNAGTGSSTLGTTTTGRRTVVMGGSNYFRLSNASTLSTTSASYFIQAFATGSNRSILALWNNERVFGPTYYWDGATSISLSPYTWSNTNAALSVVVNSASNVTGHFNGNALSTINYRAATANSNVIVGAHWSADFWWLGNIQEIIIYDVALSPGERQEVETYLMNKWGTYGSTPAGHYARLAPALSVTFVPTSVDSCALWLDGADPNALTLSGSNVTQWSDKSGNAYHFTVHPSHTAPTYSSNAVNGLNSLFFQGAGSSGVKYNILYNTSVPVNGAAFSIFAVARRNASAPSYTGGNYILTDNANSRLLYISYTSDGLLTSTGNSASGWNDVTVNSPTQTMVATTFTGMVVNGSVLTPYYNGTAQNTKGGTTTSFTGLAVGDVLNSGQSGQTWTGFICEILVYNIAVTAQQRQAVEGYLANKWRLESNLPSGHPFKTVKP